MKCKQNKVLRDFPDLDIYLTIWLLVTDTRQLECINIQTLIGRMDLCVISINTWFLFNLPIIYWSSYWYGKKWTKLRQTAEPPRRESGDLIGYWTRIVWLGGNWGVTGDWFVIYMNKLHSMDFNDFFSGVLWYLPCQDISQCRPSRNQLCYRSVTSSCWREGAKFNFRTIKIQKLELLFQKKIR